HLSRASQVPKQGSLVQRSTEHSTTLRGQQIPLAVLYARSKNDDLYHEWSGRHGRLPMIVGSAHSKFCIFKVGSNDGTIARQRSSGNVDGGLEADARRFSQPTQLEVACHPVQNVL